MAHLREAEVGIIGGGLAGLSAAVYLGRACRKTFVVDSGKSMARWEPRVDNYLGFQKGIAGEELVRRGSLQAKRCSVKLYKDYVSKARREGDRFILSGKRGEYACNKLLLATGIFHIPPDIPGVKPCLGHSMFFCKDCDGYRVHGKDIAIYGWTNESVEYALAMLLFSPCVIIVTDGHEPAWDQQHAQWVDSYHVPVRTSKITAVRRRGSKLQGLVFEDAQEVGIKILFTTRGDIYYNELARALGAELDPSGEVIVDIDSRTSVPGLFAAGCVTPANCQMIIAAGQGATAAQAINRELFEESLESRSLGRFRRRQLRRHRTYPRRRSKPGGGTVDELNLEPVPASKG